jgi:hypothetical protein
MKYLSKSIALIVFALAAACAGDPDSGEHDSPPPDDGSGSGSDEEGVTTELCNRADSCNSLDGSVEECIQVFDALLNPLPTNLRAESELAFKECLAHPSCDGFQECLNTTFE